MRERALILLLVVVSAVSLAQRAPPPYIAVVEKVGGTVGFYSEDGKDLGHVKVGNFPHEAALTKDGRFLYVTINGVLWMTDEGQGANAIAVVDTRAMKKIRDVDLGQYHRPHGIALIPGSERLLATTERPFGMVSVDPGTGKVLRFYDVKGKSPHMVTPLSSGDWAFVSDTDSDCVAAIHLETGKVKVIPTGSQPQGSVLSPQGDRLYVVDMAANQISIIDTKAQAVVGRIPTGKGPGRIAMTPDGKTLVYNLQFEPAIGFVDIASRKQVAVVPVSGRPMSLTMTRDGQRAFAGIQDQDKMVFISVPERKIERVVELPKGSGPDPAIPLERR